MRDLALLALIVASVLAAIPATRLIDRRRR
jgi:hypothetical protein